MKPVDVLEGGGEWSWVMPVFRLTAPKWCSKCMEPKVLTRLGTLSGSVAPGALAEPSRGCGRLGSELGLRPLEAARGPSYGGDKGQCNR
jgi:hypothetical protein